MTLRAFILGLFGAALLNAFCYFNDFVMRQTYLVGSYLPLPIYGGLLLFILLINAPLRRWLRRWAFSGTELAIIVGIMLAACYVPGRGLMHYFFTFQMMPHQFAKTRSSWKSTNVVDLAPDQMLADITREEAAGKIVAANGKAVALDESASGAPDAYTGMQLQLIGSDEKQAIQTIEHYDGATRTAVVAAEWQAVPAIGDAYRIISNQEEEALTPFLQGRPRSAGKTAFASIRNICRDAGPTTITLAVSASRRDHDYRGLQLTIRDGDGKGQARTITAYAGNTRVATVERAWATTPEAGDGYEITGRPAGGPWSKRVLAGEILAADTQNVTLNGIAGDTDDVLCDLQITVRDQAGNQQTRTIIDYDGETKVARLAKPWATVPATGDTFVIPIRQEVLAHPQGEVRGTAVDADESSIALGTAASHRDNVYRGMKIRLLDGPAAGQERKILRYDGSRKIAVVYDSGRPTAATNTPFRPAPQAGDAYAVMPPPTIPWFAWKRSLKFWLPLLLCFSFGMIGLALVVHRQWSRHELLAYPIAQFADSLLGDSQSCIPPVLKSRSFWIAAGIILFIHLENYGCRWWPQHLIRIPRWFDFTAFRNLSSTLKRTGASWWIFRPTFYFSVIGFAYFLSSEVSFSLGIAPYVYAYFLGIMAIMGISVGGPHLAAKPESFIYAGAFMAILVTMLYAGRHYYLSMLKQSMFLRVPEADRHRQGAWGMRVFLACMLLFIVQLVLVGLDWQLAVLYTFGAAIIFLVTSRIVAETGAFFIHPWFYPCAFLWGIMGERALGPQTLLIMLMVSSLLLIDPREALMPFVTHALKIAGDQKAHLGKVAVGGGLAVVVAFAVAVPATLYWQYSKGVHSVSDGWCIWGVPNFALSHTVKVKQRLEAQGVLEEAESTKGFSRFTKISPRGDCVTFFLVAFGLGLLCSVARLRHARWPIHPVMFAVLGTFQSRMIGPSFLLGWLVKYLITKFGGSQVYQKLKPLFFGLIAGEMLGGLLPMIIGAVYYWITGESPKSFWVFRG